MAAKTFNDKTFFAECHLLILNIILIMKEDVKSLTPNLMKDCVENNVDILHKYFLGNQQTIVYYP